MAQPGFNPGCSGWCSFGASCGACLWSSSWGTQVLTPDLVLQAIGDVMLWLCSLMFIALSPLTKMKGGVIILCSVAGSFLNCWLLDCSRVSTRSDDLGRLSMMSVTINVQSCPISDLGLCALRPLRKEVVALVRWHVGSRRGESYANHIKELAKVGWISQLFLSIFCNVCCSGVCRLRKHLSLICRWIFMQPTLSLRDIPPNHFQLILGILGWNALHNTVVEVAPPSLDSKMLRSGSPAVLRIPPLSEYSSIIFFQNEHFSREDGVWTDRLSSRPMASHSFPLTCWTCLRNRYGSVALGVISCQYDFCIYSTTCHQFPPFPTGSK